MKTLTLAVILGLAVGASGADLPKGLTVTAGPLNSAVIEKDAKKLVVYGAAAKVDKADHVLLTHARRDLVEFARSSAAPPTAPELSAAILTDPQSHWTEFWDKRFDYYGQEVTKWPTTPLVPKATVKEGGVVDWQGLSFKVIETRGYTTDMVAYIVELDGKKIAFTGDLIWEGGRVFDIYSFQSAIPDAKIGAYHGHGGRFGDWIASLRKVAAEKPDLIVPLRGPVIEKPAEDIETAITRVQAIYKNYMSTNALNWYFKADRLTIAGEKVLGKGAEIELMPYCEHIDLPDWCQHIGTTKLLVSKDKTAFALDVGGKRQFETLQQLLADGVITKLEGIWVTHTHNDHSAFVADAQREFGCPVYAVDEVADVLRNPGSWFLPGISANAVDEVKTIKDGETWQWKEFKLTGHFYPGQMYNHGGLLVEREDHKPVFFIGDSFSPSGLDDYCLMNRNLMRDDTGYLLCLAKVRALPEGSWLVNEHIPHLFRFNDAEMDHLESSYRERAKMIAEFLPWDDVNYGIDEQWAWFYPYGVEAKRGDRVEMKLSLRNHSMKERTYECTGRFDGRNFEMLPVKVEGRVDGEMPFLLAIPNDMKPGVHVLTMSIKSGDDIDVKHWCEALIRVVE
ncbi:MAG: glyoxylase-like metal-dependent hydrolase (beta-lactamase superfamily II) [Verrucomicrobiales bacterium]|jgi:glyoxylase-like metal-dependent hydrolase (beta-lactamase superfamily II)